MLNLVFNLVMFESLSGFLLFFARGFLSNPALLGAAHWWLGLVFAVPYSLYQWRHYQRVRGFNDVLQYQLGLTSFFTMAGVGGLIYAFHGKSEASPASAPAAEEAPQADPP